MPKIFTALVLVALGLGGLSLSGCVTVQPWERGRLAQPDMQFGGGTEVREGSAGGFDAAGGGCGCN